jgi:hypothetical protein
LDTTEALTQLQALLGEVPNLRSAGPDSAPFTRWLQNLLFWVPRIFGNGSGVHANFANLPWGVRPGQLHQISPFTDIAKFRESETKKGFQRDLGLAEGFLQSAIDQVREVGLEQIQAESGLMVSPTAQKIFVTHGHAEEVLRQVEDFLRASGFEPIVVKREPSGGGSVDDVVEEYMEGCAAQIILATSDDEVTGGWQPRMNVIHEVGLGQRIFKKKIVYLKEVGCEFPSNVGPKIWESFVRTDMGPAFTKINKEFRAFGLIKT